MRSYSICWSTRCQQWHTVKHIFRMDATAPETGWRLLQGSEECVDSGESKYRLKNKSLEMQRCMRKPAKLDCFLDTPSQKILYFFWRNETFQTLHEAMACHTFALRHHAVPKLLDLFFFSRLHVAEIIILADDLSVNVQATEPASLSSVDKPSAEPRSLCESTAARLNLLW